MKTIPHAKGHILWGHALELAQDPLRMIAALATNHEGAVSFRMLHRRFLAVSDPVMARHMLVKNSDNYPRSFHYRTGALTIGEGLISTEGKPWRRARRMMQPAFRSDPVREVGAVTANIWQKMADEWSNKIGQPIEINNEAQFLALNVILKALSGTSQDRQGSDHFGAAVKDGLYRIRRRNTSLFPAPFWLPTANNRALRQIRQELDTFLGPLVLARQKDQEGDDMLSALARARDDQGLPFTHEELLSQTKTLFAAGFETTATGLAWAMCELSEYPDICERLAEEANEAEVHLRVDSSTFDRLPLAGRVVDEILRLYPSVYNLGRQSINHDRAPHSNGDEYSIPCKTTLLISIWAMHRSSDWGPQSDAFDPDRWLSERNPPRSSYMPFAAGKHTCIGNHFSLVELRLAIALICQRFTWRMATGMRKPKPLARITPVPDGPISLIMAPR